MKTRFSFYLRIIYSLALTVLNTQNGHAAITDPAWLQVGDLLLQPLDCKLCTLIEEEEDTLYSHMGLVIQTHPKILIAEAYGNVRSVTYSEFISKTESTQTIKTLRFQKKELQKKFKQESKVFFELFVKEFKNLKYDSQFLWNNFDELGHEKLYCSEFVSKLIQAFASVETPIKRMHFNQNRDAWLDYFKGQIPDGEWGNSPADFENSDLFYEVDSTQNQ